ncbi:hypothetical protein CN996_19210 [Bacillus cereus]|uniref:hypothetical protein n=1 Tax=Bacillus wiedmannii TaxID=1890302 RepID=UPI000BFA0DA6|nr:hypothetical protein [Bacillus wiedmannii]PFI36192.1 hypothetical protein COI72_19820 [Bacillus cereus]PFX60234.1 hypothetical protein COL36_13180 [Bacillus wiedmannii]PGL39042.1 hypothetical protein CN930_11940 [Bacillus cereus]PGP00893.1 hypothetical protein CN996_19210 [Bacillus cereus]
MNMSDKKQNASKEGFALPEIPSLDEPSNREEFGEGVTVHIRPYPGMAVGDKVTLEWRDTQSLGEDEKKDKE